MKKYLLLSLTAGLIGSAAIGQAVLYDASADFSTSSNPNGVWSYGYFAPTFTLLNTPGVSGPYDSYTDSGYYALGVYKNASGSTVATGTVSFDAYELVQHAGDRGERSVVRYTNTVAGSYLVNVAYKGVDFVGPTTSDADLLLNGVSQWSGNVNGFGAGSLISYSTTVYLGVGDTLDSAVGFGNNGNHLFDSTGVEFSVEAVPEPMTMAVLGLGAVALLRRRRKA